ncbi:MAG: response regulator [Sphingobacteriales bacterium]|nr:MAG: response regulator [Sphingobacteriales bacterium]
MQDNEKYNILYVDDEQDNILVFKSAFRRHYNVFTATSGREGMQLLAKNNVSIIITDQRMPQMTGVEFLQSLPDQPENMRMILSGYSDMKDIVEAINIGKIFRYVSKPWSFEELKKTIDESITELERRRDVLKRLDELDAENKNLKIKMNELQNARI